MSNIIEVEPDRFFYDFGYEGKDYMNPDMTSKFGTQIRGELIAVGLYVKDEGTGSVPHRHPRTEQFIYVIRGKLKAMIEDQEKIVGPGELIYIPRNALHSTVANPGEGGKDVMTFECKVLAGCQENVPEDGKRGGPRFEAGFEDKAKKIHESKEKS